MTELTPRETLEKWRIQAMLCANIEETFFQGKEHTPLLALWHALDDALNRIDKQELLAEIGRLALAVKKVIVGLGYVSDSKRPLEVYCPRCFVLQGGPHGYNCAWGKLVAKLREVTS